MHVSNKGDVAQIEELLIRGADVNIKNNYGQTPLYKAAFYGKKEPIELLLQNGAEVTRKIADAYNSSYVGSKEDDKDGIKAEFRKVLSSQEAAAKGPN